MIDYLTVRCAGYVTYSDALIARVTDNRLYAVFLSLIGTPSHVKASSAVLFSGSGDTCRISGQNISVCELGLLASPRTYRTRKIGDMVNKVMVSISNDRNESRFIRVFPFFQVFPNPFQS